MCRISCAIELLCFLGREYRSSFLRHVNKEFLKYMVNVIKTNCYANRSVEGNIKRAENWIKRSQSYNRKNGGNSSVIAIQERCKQVLQQWVDTFRSTEDVLDEVAAIFGCYNKLCEQGYKFPKSNEIFATYSTLNTGNSMNATGSNLQVPAGVDSNTFRIIDGLQIPDNLLSTDLISDAQAESMLRIVECIEDGCTRINTYDFIGVAQKITPMIDNRIDALVKAPNTNLRDCKLSTLFELKHRLENHVRSSGHSTARSFNNVYDGNPQSVLCASPRIVGRRSENEEDNCNKTSRYTFSPSIVNPDLGDEYV